MMDGEQDRQNIQADHDSVAVGSVSVGGSVDGSLIIGSHNVVGFTSDQVSTLIAQISTTFQPKPFDGRSPYKGLDVFEEEDAELFFGREKLVDDLVVRVRASRTLFVTGPSGSGKSSLVRAGLIHALKQGTSQALTSDRWLYATMKPGRDPIEALASAFSRLKDPGLGKYLRENASQASALHECAESVLTERKDQRLVIFIDQFEEVFTQLGKDKAETFIQLLDCAASIENGRTILLFAMRSDFIPNCVVYPKLNALLNRQFVQIGAMQGDELVSAIAQPALRVGLRIDPDLIAQIINDMQGEPGALPLMQFALKDLFDAQQAKGGLIALMLKDYLERGGIRKALERHADNSFNRLNGHERKLTRAIFSSLIEIGRGTVDTRRTAVFDELVPASARSAEVEAIVRKLADARLLTTDEVSGKDTVTISHEKLIDAWPWLKRLVDENRDVIALQNEIAKDAKEWDDHNRDSSYLYTGARLATAREKIKNLSLSGNAQDYVKTSIETEEKARLQQEHTRRNIFVGLVSFLVAVTGLLLFSLTQLNISRAQRLGSQSQAALAEKNYNAAMLYAYQGDRIHKNQASDSVLSQLVYENFPTGEVLSERRSEFNSVDWAPDGKFIALGLADNTVIVWDVNAERPAHILKGHSESVYSVAWSSDGQLASGGGDGKVIVWNLNTEKPAHILQGHSQSVSSVAWSPDGQLASGEGDGKVIVWDVNAEKPAHILQGHPEYVNSVAWSSDGQLASGGGTDYSVIVWNLNTEKPAHILKGHFGSVHSVAWSRDGQLASGSGDDTVIVWDLNAEKPAHTLWESSLSSYRTTSVDWSPDGKRVAAGRADGTIILWDVQAEKPADIFRGHSAWVRSVAWSPDGRLASGGDDKTVIVWEVDTYKPAHTLRTRSDTVVQSVARSAEGQLASGQSDGTVIVWDMNTDQPPHILQGGSESVNSVAWSADGQLASGGDDGKVIVWDVNAEKPAHILQRGSESVNSVAWSSDGRLASGGNDGKVIVWDVNAEKPAHILQGHSNHVISVAWSTDGRLASGGDDRILIVWNLDTNQPALILQDRSGWPTSVAWSADGHLASGRSDGTVIVWDLDKKRPAHILRGHSDWVSSVAWSTDGRLSSGGWDDKVIVWDLNTDRPADILQEHSDDVYSVTWSPDGQLVSGSADNTIKITRNDFLGQNYCGKITRNMTIEEWRLYQGPLYVYFPACPNLYNPSTVLPTPSGLEGILSPKVWITTWLTTWKGRALTFGLLLLILVVIFLTLWISYKLFMWIPYRVTRWIWQRTKTKRIA